MAGFVGNEERSFEHYFEVPDRVRTRIVNRMSPDDRVRMTRCSKLCDKEAKASKNYVHEVHLSFDFSDLVAIIVDHRKFDPRFERRGFMLVFSENSERRVLRYHSLNNNVDNNQVIWSKELDKSTNFIQFVMEEFKKRIKYCQVSLKKLCIDDHTDPQLYLLKNIDYGIDSLEYLETLDVQGPVDIRPIFSITHKPLKRLFIRDRILSPLYVNCEQGLFLKI